jgi:sortase A
MNKKVSSIIIGLISIIALIIFGITLKRAVIAAPDEQEISVATSTEAYESKETIASYPSKISIPAIGVDAHIQRVGISKHGTMAVPTNYTDVGWYRYGTIPGNVGSAVMAGHLDNGLSLPGVFKNLKDLKTGDDIIIETESGTNIHFKVTDISSLAYDTKVTESVFGKTNTPTLKLITCEGTWNPEKKTYSDRLVLTAERAD